MSDLRADLLAHMTSAGSSEEGQRVLREDAEQSVFEFFIRHGHSVVEAREWARRLLREIEQ